MPDYGDCVININGRREITVKGGASLLATLLGQKIFIPSACGGRGGCGYCKVKVKEGGGPILPIEKPHLTAEELEQGVRLACQVKVCNNLSVEVPEELLNVHAYRATVERITDLTYDTKELRLKLIEPESISFTVGQYIQLKTPKYEGNATPVFRAYSISSPPSESGVVELIVRLIPNGICTTWIFQHLREGQEVRFNGPYGTFGLRQTERRIVFIAGGSGFAPVKAIIQDNPAEINRRTAKFFFGAKSVRDLFHVKLMQDIHAQYPRIEFIPALSLPNPGDVWVGEEGLITEVVDQRLPDACATEFYLCGGPGMIDACIAVLHKKGVTDDFIFFDKFV